MNFPTPNMLRGLFTDFLPLLMPISVMGMTDTVRFPAMLVIHIFMGIQSTKDTVIGPAAAAIPSS